MARLTPISYRKLCRVLEKAGCVFSHQKGDHLIFHKSGALRPLVIPMYKELPVFIIENNLKTAGISREQYFELLKEI